MMKLISLDPRVKSAIGHDSMARPRTDVGCTHHWIIGRATASVSSGECRVCGAQRQFPNYLSDCLANPDKESYQEWLNRQEWQEVTWSQDRVIPGLEGGKSLLSRSENSPARRGRGRGGIRRGTTTS
jgi:hypothetical protein